MSKRGKQDLRSLLTGLGAFYFAVGLYEHRAWAVVLGVALTVAAFALIHGQVES